MPLKRQRQILGGNADTIVTHAQQFDAALLDIHVDSPGASIQTVFQQFLDVRLRTVNDPASSNLVRQSRAEQLNPPHFGGRMTHG